MWKRNPAVLVLTGALLSSCTLPFTPWSPGGRAVEVAMDWPYRASMLPSGHMTNLMASASSERGGIEAIEFFANGVSLGAVATDRTEQNVLVNLEWTPTTAGTYVLQAHARGPSGVTISDPVTVCVSPVLTFMADGYSGPCTLEADTGTEGITILSAAAIPAAWAYDNGRCPSTADSAPGIAVRAIRFTFNVAIEDPGRRAAVVVIQAGYLREDGTVAGWANLGGTETTSGPGDRREYSFTLPFSGSLIDNGPGAIEWTAIVHNHAGEGMVNTDLLRIPIYVCSMPESGLEPLVIEATPTPGGATPTADASPTATLAATALPTAAPTDKPTAPPPKPTTDPNDVDDDGDGQTENDGDCDDKNDKVFKGSPETPGDYTDSNCDGSDDT